MSKPKINFDDHTVTLPISEYAELLRTLEKLKDRIELKEMSWEEAYSHQTTEEFEND